MKTCSNGFFLVAACLLFSLNLTAQDVSKNDLQVTNEQVLCGDERFEAVTLSNIGNADLEMVDVMLEIQSENQVVYTDFITVHFDSNQTVKGSCDNTALTFSAKELFQNESSPNILGIKISRIK